MSRAHRTLFLSFAFFFVIAFSRAKEGAGDGKKNKDRDPASVSVKDSGQDALKKFSVAQGLRVDLWAEEPLIANVVALSFDERGRAFVVETYRRRTSVPDIRKNMDWLFDSLAMRTVEDRIAFLHKVLSPDLKLKPSKDHADLNADGHFDWHDWEIEGERIKLVEDLNGVGKAETSSVFADGFSSLETGVAAGVVARGDDVWFACIPDIWHFHGLSAGKSVAREKLLTGFGVHIAYGGHDMHGTKFGPDGKLYWSIADCGAHVTTKEGKVIDNPDSGAVFRCNPDGSGMELVATGLRNPQSLAFNDVGDLFTGDNNADGGDKARWTHIVEGADYGWRIGWQFLPKLGAWNSEGMWHLDVDKTNLALLPPVGLIGHGPAGIAHYPGTGLPEAYRDHFFYADFPGGVRAFAIQPKGASYTVDNPKDVLQDNSPKVMTGKLLWGLYPSDVAFAPGGGVYVLDWVYGWEKTGKGRIFRVHDPVTDASAPVKETKRLLAEGMEKRGTQELAKLLGHVDQRVRLAAEQALVAQPAGAATLKSVAADATPPRLARLHAIWGLGQWAAKDPNVMDAVAPLLADADAEVRAQSIKVMADRRGLSGNKAGEIVSRITAALRDPDPRVRFFAAQALGKLNVKEAVPALLDLLKSNGDSDAYIRHAAAISLAALADEKMLKAAALDPSDAVRTGAFLALRRRSSKEVSRFLSDANPQLVLEAARAIHDRPIADAWPQLAALAGKPGPAGPVSLRASNANYLLGTGEAARRLAKIASDAGADASLRLESIESLAIWNEPFHRDRITGLWRKLPPDRDTQGAVEAAAGILPELLKDSDDSIRLASAEMAGALKVAAVEPVLLALASDSAASGETRAAALQALASIESRNLAAAVRAALTEKDKTLLATARQLAAKASPELAVEVNAAMLGHGSIREQQAAIATIAEQQVNAADKVLVAQFDSYDNGQLPPALWLDLFEAAEHRPNLELKERLAAVERKSAQAADRLAKWNECLEGGNAKAGKQIFSEMAEAACMRCHKVKGEGGDVGPDLAGIGQRHDRRYILESIVDPNAVIAPGYENVLLTLQNGDIVAGILNSETGDEMVITSLADGKKQQLKKSSVKERINAPSPMPPGLADVLGKRNLRDVIEYLATVK
jgi:quinoprotein glucose dehydrogenase